jgi:hypothetical protein
MNVNYHLTPSLLTNNTPSSREIIYRSVNRLRRDPANPRRRNEKQIRQIQLDPASVDTIVRRWQALTSGSARHATNGRNFGVLARKAEAASAA